MRSRVPAFLLALAKPINGKLACHRAFAASKIGVHPARTMSQGAFRHPVYEKHDFVEDLETYSDGGYHPVQLGDLFCDGRYRVVHKLGFGSYSTVWLALDSSLNQYVALKIIVAAVSAKSREGEVMKYMSAKGDELDKRSAILPVLLDEFWIHGPNGRHRCLVTEPARCDIGSSKEDYPFTFPLPIARAIASQMVLGIRSIHCKGIIHGDVHLRNIFLALPNLHGLPVDAIYERYHEPRRERVERVDGGPLGPEVPPYTVMPALLYINSAKVTDPTIRIGDFGEAWLSTDDPQKSNLNTPLAYLPPEATFVKDAIGPPADIWSLACCIAEILGKRLLLETLFHDRDGMIAEMVSCLGPLPQKWWDSWEVGREYFVENGVWKDRDPADMKRSHPSESRPLALRIQQNIERVQPDFSTAEAECLEKMLLTMLRWQPSERVTAEELLSSEWMMKWGFPSLGAFNIPT